RQKMLEALALVRAQLGRSYPLRIGNRRIEPSGDARIESSMPAAPRSVVGVVGKASVEQATQAIAAASESFKSWSRTAPEARARILLRAAAIMRRRLYELSAWMCFEASKSWIEGYADACEAVDFLDFYAREMMRLGGPQPGTPFPGEENELRYIPMGVTVVI